MRISFITALISGSLIFGGTALASPGQPPSGMSPIAGSAYRMQFALCSLETINSLARTDGISVATFTPLAAATKVARLRDVGLTPSAILGCRDGLMYRDRTDLALASSRSALHQRITAEKYVAAVYALIVAMFFFWVLLHTAKVTRLRRELEQLSRRLAERVAAQS